MDGWMDIETDTYVFLTYLLLHTTGPTTPPVPPQLSVTPPDGRVQPGQVVEFHCQAPPTIAPVAYVLQKQHREDEDFQVMSHSTNPQFRVGPVGVAEGGLYSCFYRLDLPEGVQNSAPSAPVSVNVGGQSLHFLTTISTVIALHCLSDLLNRISLLT